MRLRIKHGQVRSIRIKRRFIKISVWKVLAHLATPIATPV